MLKTTIKNLNLLEVLYIYLNNNLEMLCLILHLILLRNYLVLFFINHQKVLNKLHLTLFISLIFHYHFLLH